MGHDFMQYAEDLAKAKKELDENWINWHYLVFTLILLKNLNGYVKNKQEVVFNFLFFTLSRYEFFSYIIVFNLTHALINAIALTD